jgi:predicted acylesterase/phospholipase RssA
LPIGIGNPIALIRRLLQGKDGLVASRVLHDFLLRHLPAGLRTFADLQAVQGIRVRAMAVRMADGAMVAFGDRPTDLLMDGAMSSTAVAPYLGPWRVGDWRYLDGGVASKLPLCAAIARGASRIVALDVVDALGSIETAHGFLGVSGYSLSQLVEAQARVEIERAMSSGVDLHYIRLEAPPGVAFWDFRRAAGLVSAGREAARLSLERRPLRWSHPWVRWARRTIARGWGFSPTWPGATAKEVV